MPRATFHGTTLGLGLGLGLAYPHPHPNPRPHPHPHPNQATCHGSTACCWRCRGGRSCELRGGPGASARLQELSSVRPSRPLALARGRGSHARLCALRCTPSDPTLWRGVARNGSGRPARRSSRRLPRWLWPARWPVLLRRRRRARLEALRGTHRRFARARRTLLFGNWNNMPTVTRRRVSSK